MSSSLSQFTSGFDIRSIRKVLLFTLWRKGGEKVVRTRKKSHHTVDNSATWPRGVSIHSVAKIFKGLPAAKLLFGLWEVTSKYPKFY